MVKHHMTASRRKKLLLNAEPFGFGPTAAVATVFPEISPYVIEIGYIGEGHTLDLQKTLGYDRVIDCTGYREAEIMRKMKDYDIFFTALDFRMAGLARAAGLRVIIYDPLTWYWRETPPIIASVDLYIAQDFFGVRERIGDHPDCFGRAVIVSPIVIPQKRTTTGNEVLLNLGGLLNPFWSFEDTVTYARKMIRLVRESLSRHETLTIATGHSVRAALHDPTVGTYSVHEIRALMSRSSYAIMTPGLGNIYDAAGFDLPTLWLPPANDSQGQQLQRLEGSGMTDEYLDWPTLSQGMKKIDYTATQTFVLEQIAGMVRHLDDQDEELRCSVQKAIDGVRSREHSRTRELITRFGAGGSTDIATIIHERDMFV